MNGVPATIVGVSPRGFVGANVGQIADLTIPVAAFPLVVPEMAGLLGPGNYWLRVLARPQPGLSASRGAGADRGEVAAHRGGRGRAALAGRPEEGHRRRRRRARSRRNRLDLSARDVRETAPGADDRGRRRPAHRVRQRRESVAGPRRGAAERDCGAAGHRRRPGPHRPPAAGRERAAVLRGSGLRRRTRLDDGPFPARPAVDRTGARRARSHAELACPRLHGRCRHRDRHPFRARARPPGHRLWTVLGVEGRREKHRVAVEAVALAGDRAGRLVARPPRRRRPVRSQPSESSALRRGIRARRRSAGGPRRQTARVVGRAPRGNPAHARRGRRQHVNAHPAERIDLERSGGSRGTAASQSGQRRLHRRGARLFCDDADSGAVGARVHRAGFGDEPGRGRGEREIRTAALSRSEPGRTAPDGEALRRTAGSRDRRSREEHEYAKPAHRPAGDRVPGRSPSCRAIGRIGRPHWRYGRPAGSARSPRRCGRRSSRDFRRRPSTSAPCQRKSTPPSCRSG